MKRQCNRHMLSRLSARSVRANAPLGRAHPPFGGCSQTAYRMRADSSAQYSVQIDYNSFLNENQDKLFFF